MAQNIVQGLQEEKDKITSDYEGQMHSMAIAYDSKIQELNSQLQGALERIDSLQLRALDADKVNVSSEDDMYVPPPPVSDPVMDINTNECDNGDNLAWRRGIVADNESIISELRNDSERLQSEKKELIVAFEIEKSEIENNFATRCVCYSHLFV